MFSFKLHARIFFIFVALVLTACGGSGGGGEDNNSGEANNVTIPNDPPSNNNPPSIPLEKPVVYSIEQMGNSLAIYWDPANAVQYRIILQQDNESPLVFITSELQFLTPSLNSSGDYSVIVEAYDELGNSLFSDSTSIEVL